MDLLYGVFFFFKQKTAYEMRISDVSSDVCSSDLSIFACVLVRHADGRSQGRTRQAESVYRRARVSVEGPASHVFIRGRTVPEDALLETHRMRDGSWRRRSMEQAHRDRKSTRLNSSH